MDDSFIRVNDELVEEQHLEEILELIRWRGFQYGGKSNNLLPFGRWNLGFSESGNSRNRVDVSPEIPSSVLRLWQHIQPTALPQNPILVRCYVNAYTYGTDGYIHTDSILVGDLTSIVYLNREWQPNWAGETIFLQNDEIVRSILPKWKRLVTFPSHIPHAARGVSRLCPEARIVLVFKARTIEGG